MSSAKQGYVMKMHRVFSFLFPSVQTFRSHLHSVICTEEGWCIAPEHSVSFLERNFPPASQEYFSLKHL